MKFRGLLTNVLKGNSRQWDDLQPISAEIFGLERLRQHARSLAESQKVTKHPAHIYSIIRRLRDNAVALSQADSEICDAVASGKTVTPAAEWLIDNYHLIEEQIRQTRADLPEGFYRQLPKLAEGPLAGHPRIFGLVWAHVAHSDSRFDPASLTDFVNTYQEVQILTIGELWAVAISLRLILIENLRRISQRIADSRKARELADALADEVLKIGSPATDVKMIFDRIKEPLVTQAFAVQLIQRLRDHDGLSVQMLEWLKTRSDAMGYSLEVAVNEEHLRQGAANVSVRNIITSLRLISDVNWELWFDGVSKVDEHLRSAGCYAEMDFASRTLYRTAVEEIARGSAHEEIDVARLAIETAATTENASVTSFGDAGYHLIGHGREEFELRLNFHPTILRRIRMFLRRVGLLGYLGFLLLVTIILLSLGFSSFDEGNTSSTAMVLLILVAFIPASDAALVFINFVITRLVDASVIPGLTLRDGVPASLRTLVVIPALLTSHDEIEELVDRLEIHFLSNGDGELYFALVTDWTDAISEHAPADDQLLNAAFEGIARLNFRHNTDSFLILHRARLWNPQQEKWMGWERKRGKLHELNRLLRGAIDTSFVVIGGRLPDAIKFVLTLDADTKLPRDAARRLVGKIAHPLNRPQFDQAIQRVTQGYGVMQPRVTPSLPVGHYGSLFQKVFSSTRGIDPYVFAVSDVYQDLFGEGSFAGKGIYDVDAFELALAKRVPENTILSHDLFEGIFARSALVTDVEVVEEFPELYSVGSARQHRWVRGDWQLLPWLVKRYSPVVKIPALGQWKMIDNIRRSLSQPTTLLSLLLGWYCLPFEAATIWTGFIVLLSLVPALLPAISGALPRQQSLTLESRMKSIAGDFTQALAIAAANFIFLGHQSCLMIDAIGRTLYRLVLSRKNLLEWTTAAQSQSNSKTGIIASYHFMHGGVAFGLFTLIIAYFRAGDFWILLSPFAIAWIVAPLIAYQMSLSPKLEDALETSPADRKMLRLIARRTWTYFETFVTVSDSMLPPDNFQETPKPTVAHRTSPTNIGLYLLSIASAREFGWMGLRDTIKKIEATVTTVKTLEKYRGHLYNWYETTSLRPLEPKYVSTVDSGNFAGHLIAVSNCLTHWMNSPHDLSSRLNGIGDILDIIEEDIKGLPNDRSALKVIRTPLESELKAFRRLLEKTSERPESFTAQLISLAVQCSKIQVSATRLAVEVNTPAAQHFLSWTKSLQDTVESHLTDASLMVVIPADLVKRIGTLNADIRELALMMEFGFLLDPQRLLFSIGYRVVEAMRDESCYDMLASEARLASFFAIAKGDLRTRHWFRLGRTVTAVRGGAALVSWSGSMFEYLMPSLVMRAPSAGLLDQTMHLVVRRQIAYATALGLPWGISESAFNARDIEFTYQYSNFGVPGLGLKRGLADNQVIAPYATALAAMVEPCAAARNFKKLSELGARGDYGFYEALDFTPTRLRKGETTAIVRSYFAHHQGMTIVALLNAVKNGAMRSRFHDEPMIKASELLLQERASRDVPLEQKRLEASSVLHNAHASLTPTARLIGGLTDGSPSTHVLSNGQYSVMLTVAGSGYSIWNGLALTRWREDSVCDDWGSFIYLRERRTGKTWSAGFMPIGTTPDSYAVNFSEDKAEFIRQDGNITTALECVVSSEDNGEARRVTLTNTGLITKEIEFTSYVELVLAPTASDIAHPAFSKMFVTTEYVAEQEALLATRRKRSPGEPNIWVAQFMLVKGSAIGELEIETDRALFLGFGNSTRMPSAMSDMSRLSGTVGNVLDPVFVMRRRLRIPAGRQITCTIWTVAAESRDGILDLVDKHRQTMAYDRALTLAWTQAQIQLRHLSIDVEDAHLYQTLASHIIYANAALRPSSKSLKQDGGAQSHVWPLGISGDRPIVLVRIDNVEDIEMVHQLLHAFVYWKTKRLIVDLVILNDRMSSYVQDLQSAIEALVRKINLTKSPDASDGLGQVFVLRGDLAAAEAIRVLPSVARIVLYARRGSLALQMARLIEGNVMKPMQRSLKSVSSRIVSRDTQTLEFFNGFGGFSADGAEYVVDLRKGQLTPAPWINVVANTNFGFQSAVDGGGYTWQGNSRENKLTSWGNDPVSNPLSEVIYVQDEADGDLLSPSFAPLNSSEGTHRTRHGHGYTIYERDIRNLRMELLQFVPLSDSIKISCLKISSTSSRSRTFKITHYVEWVMGTSRGATSPFLNSEIDGATGAIMMRNPWNLSAGEQIAFADMGGLQSSWTGDRREFLGTYGSLDAPNALLNGSNLSNRTGAGMDPCSVLQTQMKIKPGETIEILILLGAGTNIQDAQSLITRYRDIDANDVLASVKAFWDQTLGQVQVKTPDRSFNIMMNGWLLYQTLACRMWARSGFYQASGAFGFRDQLQDSMALLTAQPELARAHILKAAARQFVQGDFQHWWLPAKGAGVRTRISDDTIWLANCVSRYVKVTGDFKILDEMVHFIEGQQLLEGEHDAFFLPTSSEEVAPLYEHCARALDRSLAHGTHGLPLMGTGDWNDGMNRVGEAGLGESVWLGWFLFSTLQDFIPIAEARGDIARTFAWQERAKTVQIALEEHGWDGKWYRRGYYDDGTPLGSAFSEECQIDAIAQSWAVISGGAKTERAAQAMEQSYQQLVRQDDGLMRLFTPPFDKTTQEPGYIKAYPPGTRENGGQYTHGAIWSIFAHAELKQPDRAMELFSMLNPINHSKDEASARNYRVEPYVIAADVYSMPPHVGRGGWTWYTGSAGWMHRAGLEAILGITREGEKLRIKPCVPDSWNEFEVSTQFGKTRYEIKLSRASGLQATIENAIEIISPDEFLVSLFDSGGVHRLVLKLNAPSISSKK
jgi:cyclic beta-1,2-glucan synthetase